MHVMLAQTVSPTVTPKIPTSSVAVSAIRRVEKGLHLYYEGDGADFIYEVVSGVLRLERVLENGRRQVVAFGYPGDIVGFPAGTRYHTDCEVVADAEVIVHRRSMLDDGRDDLRTHRRLVAAAMAEITGMQDHFMLLGRKCAQEKLASFLMTLARRATNGSSSGIQIHLPMSRGDIADFLGLTIETVSRQMTRLRAQNIVSLDGPHLVTIHDADSLARIADAD